MEEKKVIIDVNHVTVRFNLATQKIDNLKEYFVKLVKRQLMFLLTMLRDQGEEETFRYLKHHVLKGKPFPWE